MKTIKNNSIQAGNLKNEYSFLRLLYTIIILISSALVANLAFPEFNISILGFVTIIPVFLATRKQNYLRSIILGYIWSYAYCVAMVFWLREIHLASPFILSLLLACFYMPLFIVNVFLRRRLLYPAKVLIGGFEKIKTHKISPLRKLFYCLTLTAIWTICEWLRSWVLTGLPWNYLATTQWQNIQFIQICEYTGIWGISFLIAFVNFTLVEDFRNIKSIITSKKITKNTLPCSLILAFILLTTNYIYGYNREVTVRNQYKSITNKEVITFGVIQGDLSQRRDADSTMALEAVNRYVNLTYRHIVKYPNTDVIVWPESAAPMPYNSGGSTGNAYRIELFSLMSKIKKDFLIGAMFLDEFKSMKDYKMVNSVLQFSNSPEIVDRYNKIHIVPFGEFVPMRKYLPDFLLETIDMGRDLKRGTDYSPLKLKNDTLVGINICFEDVFPEITRREAQLGANVILVVSNDAWYPKSSEPTQHLANSIFRTIESRLPMVRNGNNSSSVLVSPTGEIIDSAFNDNKGNLNIAKRGQTTRKFTVNITKKPQLSFYTRYGNIFIWLCNAIVIVAFAVAISKIYQHAKHCDDKIKKIKK